MRRRGLDENTNKQPQFHGKVALITGGTAGIGAAMVKRISELGANVLFTGRHVENAQRIIRDTERNPGEVVFVQASTSLIPRKSGMRKRARTDLRGGDQ